jgi:hypothetical protein
MKSEIKLENKNERSEIKISQSNPYPVLLLCPSQLPSMLNIRWKPNVADDTF